MSTIRFSLLAAILVLGACGSDDVAPADTGDTATTAPADNDDAPSTTATEDTRDTPPITVDDVDESVPWLDLGVPLVDGLEAEDGPDGFVLTWNAVDGADRYEVLAFDPDGGLAWTSVGDETEALLGGPAPVLGSALEQLSAGSTWVVLAVDADGIDVAVSAVTRLDG